MWTSIIQEGDKEKLRKQKINFLSHKLSWISYLIIQTKKSKLTEEYGLNSMKDIVRALEKVGDEIAGNIEDLQKR